MRAGEVTFPNYTTTTTNNTRAPANEAISEVKEQQDHLEWRLMNWAESESTPQHTSTLTAYNNPIHVKTMVNIPIRIPLNSRELLMLFARRQGLAGRRGRGERYRQLNLQVNYTASVIILKPLKDLAETAQHRKQSIPQQVSVHVKGSSFLSCDLATLNELRDKRHR